jgi:hypothetical protein
VVSFSGRAERMPFFLCSWIGNGPLKSIWIGPNPE